MIWDALFIMIIENNLCWQNIRFVPHNDKNRNGTG